MNTSDFDQSILDVVRGKEPISTPALAADLGEDEKNVYKECRKLEQNGLLSSTLEQGRRLLFCVDDKEALTAENYEDHKGHDLRSFYSKVRVWKLTKSDIK